MEPRMEKEAFDYSHVATTARVALYEDMGSAPRVTEIAPAPTADYIEKLASTVWEQSKIVGGKLPYTLIREVSENFIHAQFKEIVVSVLDDGNTIRFADQGPGIRDKENAVKPGFTSAIEPMKKYIRGVGSGLPIVQDFLSRDDGTIIIEDNLESGAVVTITLDPKYAPRPSNPAQARERAPIPVPTGLTERERTFIGVLLREGELGITELKDITGTAPSTTFNTLKKLEEAGIVDKVGKKRALSPLGYEVAGQIL